LLMIIDYVSPPDYFVYVLILIFVCVGRFFTFNIMKFLGICFSGEVMEFFSEMGIHMKWIFVIVLVSGKCNPKFVLSDT